MTTLIFVLLLFGCNHTNTFSQGQNQTTVAKDTIKSQTKNSITSYGPKSIVRSVIQDRKGNIWMASWDGIFRYDGKSFTNITSKESSGRFFSILEDSKGNFWFGTIGEGAYYFDGTSFKNFTTINGLLNNEVTSIYEDKKGNIWFGVSGGASCYDGKIFRNYIIDENVIYEAWKGKTFTDRQPNSLGVMMEDKTGKLWISTKGEAYIYDGKTFAVLRDKDGKAFYGFGGITKDRKGNIWFSANDGIWRYDDSTFTKFSEKGASSILEDKKGNIWTSSTTAMYNKPWTLSRYDEKSLYNEKPTVTEITNKQLIFGILEDYDGNIWFGSGHGVYRYDGKTITDFKEIQGDN
ncbi:histidine kinase [Spirosoma sp. KCTC 42546]|nr:histidine kinase [Spirosoma sp. KCTC 42546]